METASVREASARVIAVLSAAGRSRTGAHAAADDGSLAILRFTGAPGLGLVHLGGIGGGVCLEGKDDLEAYERVFEQLQAFALSPAQSALLLRGLVGD
jgi:hypothetical protein